MMFWRGVIFQEIKVPIIIDLRISDPKKYISLFVQGFYSVNIYHKMMHMNRRAGS